MRHQHRSLFFSMMAACAPAAGLDPGGHALSPASQRDSGPATERDGASSEREEDAQGDDPRVLDGGMLPEGETAADIEGGGPVVADAVVAQPADGDTPDVQPVRTSAPDAAAEGGCRKDERRCSGGAPQLCNWEGAWQVDPNAPTCAPDQVCDQWSGPLSESHGTCISNELQVRGYTAPGERVLQPAFGDFIAVSLKVDIEGRLTKLGALTVAAVPPTLGNQGGQAVMFLYADSVADGKHRPGRLLAYSVARDLVVGLNLWSPLNTGVILKPSELYWLAIDVNGAPGDQVRLYGARSSEGEAVLEWATKVPASVLDEFPLSTSVREENARVSLFLQLQRR